MHPKKLIVADVYENSTYELQQELRRSYGGGLDFAAHIVNVQDAALVRSLFETYRPELVFHAAAHKHDSVIGAGAVVVKNIKEPGTYVGVPARKIEK